MKKQLETFLYLQRKFPELSIGGSIGLAMCGFPFIRDLSNSDLDLTTSVLYDELKSKKSKSGSSKEMQYVLENFDIDIDVQHNPTNEFITVMHEGIYYQVTKPFVTLQWKIKWAEQGYEKHQKDLDFMNIKYTRNENIPVIHHITDDEL